MAGSLILFLDDAPADMMRWMPHVRRLARRGVTFTRGYATSPVCAPSRAGLLVGRWAENTGVFINATSGPGSMDQALTDGTWSHANLGYWLDQAGVRSMMIGKYHVSQGVQAPPPGMWTTSRAIYDAYDTRGYTVRDENGNTTKPDQWVNDYIRDQIIEFIDAAEQADDDWVVYWPSASPHWPFVTAPGAPLAGTDATWTMPPQDGTGWPSWVNARPRVTDHAAALTTTRGMAAECLDVDAKLRDVTDHLADLGALDASTIYVTSDNGVHRGDHRKIGPATKNSLYEAATLVPYVACGPDYPIARTIDVPVPLIDITADILTRYDVTPTWPLDGIPLRDVVANSGDFTDRGVLIQVRPMNGDDQPPVDAVATTTHKLARNDATDPDRYELYDLANDPGELVNLAYDPEHIALRDDLEGRLDALLTP